jgi:hypothetical protein
MEKNETQNVEPLDLAIEVLEERIAPSTTGYEGQPGGQSNGGGNAGGGGGGNTGYEGQPGGQSNG